MTLRAAAAAAKRFIGQGVASRAVVPRSSGAALQRSATLTTSAVRPPTECITFASHQTRTFFSKERSKSVYEYGAHRSDAEARIAEMPIVQVDGPVALCEGGQFGTGGNSQGWSAIDICRRERGTETSTEMRSRIASRLASATRPRRRARVCSAGVLSSCEITLSVSRAEPQHFKSSTTTATSKHDLHISRRV